MPTAKNRSNVGMITAFLFVGAACGRTPGPQSKPQTINASVDAQGNAQTATAAINGPARITCTIATNGGGPNSRPATCYVTAPGVNRDVTVGQTVGTSGAGTVTLACDGNPYPLRCTARIEEE
jgi:hypothetical protein